MKEIAKSMAFPVVQKPKHRTTWLKHDGLRLNIIIPASIREFYKMKSQLIKNKEIDIGELIVPMQYSVVVVSKDGTLVSNMTLIIFCVE